MLYKFYVEPEEANVLGYRLLLLYIPCAEAKFLAEIFISGLLLVPILELLFIVTYPIDCLPVALRSRCVALSLMLPETRETF